jgi:DNA-binding GntR family transcriptional regulator
MYTLATMADVDEVRRMRAEDRAYAGLLGDIQDGRLRPGAVLGEVEQATRLGVSRTPLRAALGRLAADGLVQRVSPRVTVVRGLDAQHVRALYELRVALETEAARLAAARADRNVFAALAAEFATADTVGDADGYYALIARFDDALDAALANDYFVSALRTVRTHLVRVRRLSRDDPSRLARSADEHRLLATAIAQGDGELAVSVTRMHLHHALSHILPALSEGPS